MGGDETVVVPHALAGTRVDRVVALLTGLPRSQVRRLVEEGHVRLGGRPVLDPSRRVVPGEALDFESGVAVRTEPPGAPAPSAAVPFNVVYEDQRIVVVDKPAGVVVHPGAGHREDTLVAGLLARYPDLAAMAEAGAGGVAPERPGIVHRLDKDTSGLMVVARDVSALAHLAAQLATRTMGREYVALVAGDLAADEGVVDAPLRRSERDRTRMAIAAGGQGRAARTHYRVTRRYRVPIPTSQLVVRLETGRTHQIRAHLSAIGHPVVGDATYGGRRRELPVGRPFLHAWRLELLHPEDGRLMSWTSELPEELARVLAGLS